MRIAGTSGTRHLAASFALALAFCALVGFGGDLWSKGRAHWTIACDADAAEPVTFAAEELKDALSACSGAHFPISTSLTSGGGTILVGAAGDGLLKPHAAALDLDPKSPDEQAVIRLVRKNLLVIAGNTPEAALDAAHAFLVEFVGVRYLWIGDEGTFYPKRETLTLPAKLDWRRVPKIRWRGYHLCGEAHRLDDFLLWMSRNCMNITTRKGRVDRYGMRRIAGGHILEVDNPKEEIERHPEWFALIKGERDYHFPCCRHPEATKAVIRHVLALAERMDKPDLLFFSLFAPDGSPDCTCKLCRGHSVSDNLFTLQQRVTEALRRSRPNLPVGGLAYAGYMSAPTVPIRNCTMMEIATENKCPHCVIDNPQCPWNRFLIGIFEGWKAFATKNGGLVLGEYGYEFDLYCEAGDARFVPNFTLLEDSVKVAIRYNHVLIVPEAVLSPPDGPMEAVGQYVNRLPCAYYARAMWDPSLTAEAFLRDTARTVWGPAEEPMTAYFKRLDKAWRETGIHTVMWKPHPESEARSFLAKNVYAAAKGLLNNAEKRLCEAAPDTVKTYPTFDAERAKEALEWERNLLAVWAVAAGYETGSDKDRVPIRPVAAAASVQPTHLVKANGREAKLAVRCAWSPKQRELIVTWEGAGQEKLAAGLGLSVVLWSKKSDGACHFRVKDGRKVSEKLKSDGTKVPRWTPDWRFTAKADGIVFRLPLGSVDKSLKAGEELSARFSAGIASDRTDAAYPSFSEEEFVTFVLKN